MVYNENIRRCFMKYKVIIAIVLVIIAVSIFIYINNKHEEVAPVYSNQGYTVKKDGDSIILTKYETSGISTKSVTTYYFSSGKFVKSIVETYYAYESGAKDAYKDLKKNNTVTIKDNVITTTNIGDEEYINVSQNELMNLLEKRYENEKSFKKDVK
jgi:hypothetical protein